MQVNSEHESTEKYEGVNEEEKTDVRGKDVTSLFQVPNNGMGDDPLESPSGLTSEATDQMPSHYPFGASKVNPYLPQQVQQKMERSFNQDFSNVNIYQNSVSAQQLSARAYAYGNDLHFAPGEYNPYSESGLQLLGHELAHVVQQRQGLVAPTDRLQKGLFGNQTTPLEQQADEWGGKAARGIELGLDRLPTTPNQIGVVQKTSITDPERPRFFQGEYHLRIDADGDQFNKELELIFRVRKSSKVVTDEDGSLRVPGTVEVLVKPTQKGEQNLQSVLTFEIDDANDFEIGRQVPALGVYGYEIFFQKQGLILNVGLHLDQIHGTRDDSNTVQYQFALWTNRPNENGVLKRKLLKESIQNVRFPSSALDRDQPLTLRKTLSGEAVDEFLVSKQEGVTKEAFYLRMQPYGDQFEISLNKSTNTPGIIEWSAKAVSPLISDRAWFSFYAKHQIPVPYASHDDNWFENLQIRVVNTGHHVALFFSIPGQGNESISPAFYTEPSAYFFMAHTPVYYDQTSAGFFPSKEQRESMLQSYVPKATEDNGLMVHRKENESLLFRTSRDEITTEGSLEQGMFTYNFESAPMTILQHVKVLGRKHAQQKLGDQTENTSVRFEARMLLFNLARLINQARRDGFIPEAEYQLYYQLALVLVRHDSILEELQRLQVARVRPGSERLTAHFEQYAEAYDEIETAFDALVQNQNQVFMDVHDEKENRTIQTMHANPYNVLVYHDELLYKAGKKLKANYDQKLAEEKQSSDSVLTSYYTNASKELELALDNRLKYFKFVEQVNQGDIVEFHSVQSFFYSGPHNYHQHNVKGIPGKIYVFKTLTKGGGCTWHIASLMQGKFFKKEKSYTTDQELPHELFKLLDDKDFAQEGILIYQVPGLDKHGEVEMTSPYEFHDYLSFGALALNGVGLVCTATGIGAPVGIALFALGGAVQAASSYYKAESNMNETGSDDYSAYDYAYLIVDSLVALTGFGPATATLRGIKTGWAQGIANSRIVKAAANSKVVQGLELLDPITGLTSYVLTTGDSLYRVHKKVQEGDISGATTEILFLLFTGGMGIYAAREQLGDFGKQMVSWDEGKRQGEFLAQLKSKPTNVSKAVEEVMQFKNDLNLKPEELLAYYKRKRQRELVEGDWQQQSPEQVILQLKKDLEGVNLGQVKQWLEKSPDDLAKTVDKSMKGRDAVEARALEKEHLPGALDHLSKIEKLEVLENFKGNYQAASIDLIHLNEMRELEKRFRRGEVARDLYMMKLNYHFIEKRNQAYIKLSKARLEKQRIDLKETIARQATNRKASPAFDHYHSYEQHYHALSTELDSVLKVVTVKDKLQQKIVDALAEIQAESLAKAIQGQQKLVDGTSKIESLRTLIKQVKSEATQEQISSGLFLRLEHEADQLGKANGDLEALYQQQDAATISQQFETGKFNFDFYDDLIQSKKDFLSINENMLKGSEAMNSQFQTFGKELYGNGFKSYNELFMQYRITVENKSIAKVMRGMRFLNNLRPVVKMKNTLDNTKLSKFISKWDSRIIGQNYRSNMIHAYKNLLSNTLPIVIRLMVNNEMNHRYSQNEKNLFAMHFEKLQGAYSATEILAFVQALEGQLLTDEELLLLEGLAIIEEAQLIDE